MVLGNFRSRVNVASLNIIFKLFTLRNGTVFIATRNKHFKSLKPAKSYYKILNVSSNATVKSIKEQYYKESKRLHPDTSSENNVGKFLEAQQAYKVLSDVKSRFEYDSYLSSNSNYDFEQWLSFDKFTESAKTSTIYRNTEWKGSQSHTSSDPYQGSYRSEWSKGHQSYEDKWSDITPFQILYMVIIPAVVFSWMIKNEKNLFSSNINSSRSQYSTTPTFDKTSAYPQTSFKLNNSTPNIQKESKMLTSKEYNILYNKEKKLKCKTKKVEGASKKNQALFDKIKKENIVDDVTMAAFRNKFKPNSPNTDNNLRTWE